MNPWPVEGDVPEVHTPRPGHADLAGVMKYGFTDVRNVLERASARETAARVAGGALAKAFLRAVGVEVVSHVIQINSRPRAAARRPHAGGLRRRRRLAGPLPGRRDRRARWSRRSTCCASATSRSAASSRCAPSASCPASARTSPGRSAWTAASAWRCSRSSPSRAAASATASTSPAGRARRPTTRSSSPSERGWYRETNRSGGVEGGMTTGEPLVVRAAAKPLPTLTKPLRTVDIATHEPAQALRERTDSAVVPAAGVVGEAMLAIVLADGLPREVRRRPHRRRPRRARRVRGAHRLEAAAALSPRPPHSSSSASWAPARRRRPAPWPPSSTRAPVDTDQLIEERARDARSRAASRATASARSASEEEASCSSCSPPRRRP